MSSDCADYWLFETFVIEILANHTSGLVTIYEGHVAVHEYELIAAICPFMSLHILDNLIVGFLAIKGHRTNLLRVNSFEMSVKFNESSGDIKALVINNHHFPFLGLSDVFPGLFFSGDCAEDSLIQLDCIPEW